MRGNRRKLPILEDSSFLSLMISHYNNRQVRDKHYGKNIIWVYRLDNKVLNYLTDIDAHITDSYHRELQCIIQQEKWKVVIASPNSRGYRTSKAIIDSRIPIEHLKNIVHPSCMSFCYSVSYF